MSEAARDPLVEVERLVADLRDRVARRRADGDLGDDLSGVALELPRDEAPVRFRADLAYSTRPVVGPVLTAVKRLLFRLLIHPLDDLARQTSAAVGRVEAEVREVRRWSEASWRAEVAAREAAVEDLVGARRDIVSLLRRIEALERLELGLRVARLERSRRATPLVRPVVRSEDAVRSPGSPAEVPLDYAAFKARFGGSSEEVSARQSSYVDALMDRRRVVDLGCGHGELLTMLAGAGVSAYGVETDADFVERLREQGIEVVEDDALAHLRSLAPGAVDGVVASHVIEHLPAPVAVEMIRTAWEVLPPGGVLIIDTPNPESVVAGSVNFHRDPTHVAPIHPDTLEFLCEMSGFTRVEVRRLSPVPAEQLLPSGEGDGPLGERLDRVVAQLNDLLYGYRDYAVLAWR